MWKLIRRKSFRKSKEFKPSSRTSLSSSNSIADNASAGGHYSSRSQRSITANITHSHNSLDRKSQCSATSGGTSTSIGGSHRYSNVNLDTEAVGSIPPPEIIQYHRPPENLTSPVRDSVADYKPPEPRPAATVITPVVVQQQQLQQAQQVVHQRLQPQIPTQPQPASRPSRRRWPINLNTSSTPTPPSVTPQQQQQQLAHVMATTHPMGVASGNRVVADPPSVRQAIGAIKPNATPTATSRCLPPTPRRSSGYSRATPNVPSSSSSNHATAAHHDVVPKPSARMSLRTKVSQQIFFTLSDLNRFSFVSFFLSRIDDQYINLNS